MINIAKRNKILQITALVFVVMGILAGILYLLYANIEFTDDAYVNGNQVAVNARISGTIIKIYAEEPHYVNKGDALIYLDPKDTALELEKAKQALAETVRGIRSTFINLEELNALVVQRRLEVTRAEEDYNRRTDLLKKELVSPEEVSHLKNSLEIAKAALLTTEKQAMSLKATIDNTTLETHPTLLKNIAIFKQAYLNAKRHVVVAPASGYVVKRAAQVGQYITPQNVLFTIVPINEIWVEANYKESQIAKIKPGQSVTLEADVYKGTITYKGIVAGLAPGTGASFALLPAQNASGNWIKVVQRVAVRIKLLPDNLANYPLRLGLSMGAKVKTNSSLVAVESPKYETDIFSDELAEADCAANEIINDNLGKIE